MHDQATEQGRQLQNERGEEQSTIEITMEMDEIDTEMDTTIVEQGTLPNPAQTIEAKIYDRLVRFEVNDIQ